MINNDELISWVPTQDPYQEELARLRVAAFVALGALKAISPKDSQAVKFVEDMLFPKPLLFSEPEPSKEEPKDSSHVPSGIPHF